MIIRLNHVEYSYSQNPDKQIIQIKNLSFEAGKKYFIYGPSGSGKSTLLNLLTGLIAPSSGEITVLGKQLNNLSSRKRDSFRAENIGYIYQKFNLIPYLDAIDNIKLANYFDKTKKTHDIQQAANESLNKLNVPVADRNRPIQQLSVGQQQRVAIARALLIQPRLLLMDEPLAALDSPRKREILPYLEALHRELKIPVLYVTHSLEEVARLADHMLILEQGRVREQGPMLELLASVDSALGDEEGSGAVLIGKVAERNTDWHQVRVTFPGGSLWVSDGGDTVAEQLRLRILARDVSLSIVDNHQSSIVNRLPCTISEIANDRDESMALVALNVTETNETNVQGQKKGSVKEVECPSDSSRLLARISRRSVHELQLKGGMQVWAQIKSVAILR